MNVFLGLCSTVAVVLFGVAVGVMSMTPPEYDVARGSLIGFSVATIITYLLWIGTAPPESLLLKVAVGLACGIVALGLLPVGLQWITTIQTRNFHSMLAEENRQTPRYFGVISPQGSDVRFSNQPGGPASNLEIGDSGAIFGWRGTAGAPLFNFYGSNLTVEVIDGEVKVSTQIRNSDGNLVAEMIRNEWAAAPPPQTWDRNYSRDSVEIIEPSGKVVLQVRALPDRIQLQGEWRGVGGYGTRLVKSQDPAHPGGLIILMTPQNPEGGPNSPQIPRMFVYPSGLHLGQVRQ
jgi:hypothetical protein